MKCNFLIAAGTVALVFAPWNAHAEDVVLVEPIEVVAKKMNEARNSIMPETGSSIYRLNQDDIGSMPQGDATPLNQVLLRAPGVAQDSFGQLHVRGDHANLQYRINDVIIPESIAGFGQTLDPRFFGEVNFLTGALPAQYGYRTAGVVDIHTKSGIQAPGGSIGLMGGSYDTVNPSIEFGGLSGRTDYYVTAQYLHNSIGIENPTADRTAIHDDTNQWKGFGYYSHLLNDTSRVSVLLGSSVGNFQIPNSPGHTPSFALNGGATPTPFDSTALNENQRETTQYGILAFQGKGGTDLDYQLALFSRYSQLHFRPDPIGDLVFNGVASDVYRSSFSNGLQGDSSYKLSSEHTLRSGIFYSREYAVTNNTSAVFQTDPTGAQLPGQGPISITDNNSTVAFLYGAYLQDEWKLTDKFTLNYGARYDYSDSYIKEGQLSPRLGAVYKATATTTLHAGFSRYFTPPPTELVAPKTLALFQNTTNAPVNNVNDPVKSERSNYYDLGIIQTVTPQWTTGLDGYYKRAHNLLDEGQFGAALVFTPFNYEEAKVYGIEWTNSYHKDNFGAYLNVALSKAMGKGIDSAQFNFSQADLDYIATHYIHLDHDQRITASGGVSYVRQKTTYTADVLFGTGLRRDGDVPNGDHVPGYATVNLGAFRPFTVAGLGEITARVAVLNVFDRTYEIRDGTGIGVGAPQFGMRRAFFAGATKSF